MSLSLVWTRKVSPKDIRTGLKWVLEKRYRIPYELTRSDIPYLQGLADANEEYCKEIEPLIEAIEKYDEITLEYE